MTRKTILFTRLRDVYGAKLFVTNYTDHIFERLPWGDSAFDCFVVILSDSDYTQEADQLVRARIDWIEIFGVNSESFHDLVDAASVAVGRQEKVGDGSPMTTWNDNLSDFADLAKAGGQGTNNNKLILFLGENAVEQEAILSLLSGGEKGDRS